MVDAINKEISLKNFKISNSSPIVLIGGPCVIESEDHAVFMAEQISKITTRLEIPFIFKSSFDKANRTSVSSYRGPGLEEGLRILGRIKKEVGVPVLSDVHEIEQVNKASKILDVLQIPAFLCRQTDLLLSAAKTNLIVNVKKGQFLAPWDMKHIIDKLESQGNSKIMLTERGTSFGYNNLIVDMRSLAIMKGFGYPVVFDATHAVQLPGGMGSSSGGQSEFVSVLANAATAVGIAALFLEIHDNPSKAKSDGPNMVDLNMLKSILERIKKIDIITKE